MNLNDKQIDVLDRFLRNEMSNSDRVEWEKMMQEPLLQDEIRNMTHLQQMIRDEGRERLRQELDTWDKSSAGSIRKKAGGKRVPMFWRWAAAAVLFLGTVTILLLSNKESNPEALFASFFEPYPNIVAPIQKGESTEDPFARAFQLYEAGRYQDALNAFEGLPQKDPSIIFYSGICQVELGDDEGAKSTFGTLNIIPNHPYRQAVEWYLALLELKTGSIEKASLMIDMIASRQDHPFHRKAMELRRELDHN